MYVAMITNTAWLDEELPSFCVLADALIDEKVSVLQVMPDRVAADEVLPATAILPWRDSSWKLLRHFRLRRLFHDLEEAEVDIIHAQDGRLWSGAIRLAELMEVPVVLTASSMLDLQLIEQVTHATALVKVAIVAKTEPLAQAFRERLPKDMTVEVVRPGVAHADLVKIAEHRTAGSLCAVISGEGGYDIECQALFAALRKIIERYPQAQFFFDGQRQDQHALWEAAQQAGLLSNLSTVARRIGHRELLLRADVMIHPQPTGRFRSLTVQAMASRMPVIARQDPWVDYLIEDQTAWLVDKPDDARWLELIDRVVAEQDKATALGQRACEWVSGRYDHGRQIGQMLRLYRQLCGEAIRFPAGNAQ
jgi:glycosyltransferase involved in cell wall biosynthesis